MGDGVCRGVQDFGGFTGDMFDLLGAGAKTGGGGGGAGAAAAKPKPAANGGNKNGINRAGVSWRGATHCRRRCGDCTVSCPCVGRRDFPHNWRFSERELLHRRPPVPGAGGVFELEFSRAHRQ